MPSTPYAIRGYTISLFFFSVLFGAVVLLLREFRVGSKQTSTLLFLYIVLFAFPDHWLGLDRYFVHVRGEYLFDWLRDERIPRPVLEFFPSGFSTIGKIPGEIPLWSTILISGGMVLSSLIEKKYRGLFGLLFLMVVFQTWIHQSLRSPYSYMPHFEGPSDHWWHSILFINGQGAVNGDYPWFRQAEETFIGIQAPLAPLWDRMFPAFLTSSFSRYIHPYPVGIFLNVLSWWAAVVAVFYLTLWMISEKAARYAAFLMMSSQGMIIYAAQPMIYVFAYASLPVVLMFYWRFFHESHPNVERAILLGLVSGLSALSYDLQPWWIVFLLVPFLLRKEKKLHLFFVAVSFLIYFIYHHLWRLLPAIQYHSALVDPSLSPVREVFKVIQRHDLLEWLQLSWATVSGWVTFTLRAFMAWIITACTGLCLLGPGRKRLFCLLLFLPAALTYAMMQWSRTEYYLQFPRIVFSAFPVVYLLSGKCLEWLSDRGRGYAFLVKCLLAFHLILMNMDTFGFPYIHMHWFYRGTTLPQLFNRAPH